MKPAAFILWFSVSSTSALIFVFTPVYTLGGGLVAWGIVWFAKARFLRSRRF